MHAFSGEFALADGVTGALGAVGAHMTVYAFGSPWTLLSYKGPISKTSFSIRDPIQADATVANGRK